MTAILYRLSFCWLLQILICKVHGQQIAGYYCLTDKDNSDILHIDFQLDTGGETINHVYAVNQSTGADLNDCSAQYDSAHALFHLRVSVSTSLQQQTSPASDCGLISENGQYKLKMKALASEVVVSSSDRQYFISCEYTTESQTTGTASVGSIGHIVLTDPNPFVRAIFVLASDINTQARLTKLGDIGKIKYTLTFSNNKENLDIIGARVISLIVAPTSQDYNAINRTILENGCPVNHSQSALAVDGPFETTSNGTSPFVAISPDIEVGYFKGQTIGVLFFTLKMEYCFTVDCFQVTCGSNRRKRRSADARNTVTTTLQVTVENPENGEFKVEYETTSTACPSETTFAAVTSSLLILVALEVSVIVYKGKQLSRIRSKVVPSPDERSLDNIPLHNSIYRNPIEGANKNLLDKPNFGHVIL